MRRVGPPVAMLAIVQPREETHPSGALDIVTSGELRRHQVRAVIGAHVQPRLPAGTAAAHHCAGTVQADQIEPPLSNDPRLARYARGWLTRSGSSVSEGFRSCGSDDFSHYGTRLPSLMMFVGTGEGVRFADAARTALPAAR